MRFACRLAACLLAGALAGFVASARGAELLGPGDRLAGVSQEEWSRRWWQWAASFDDASSPVADRTGQRCASRQSGNVWFLAGTYGTQRTVRTCRVPAGKHLFFPLINYVTYPGEGRREACSSLVARAAQLTEEPQLLVLEIEGHRFDGLARHRQASRGCFALEPGSQSIAAANGYYVALKPLPKGTHKIEFGGILPGMMQAVTYTLIVE